MKGEKNNDKAKARIITANLIGFVKSLSPSQILIEIFGGPP
jgi:hypothetical protein